MAAPFTLRDAEAERHAQDDRLWARMEAREAEERRIAGILRDNPSIGILQRANQAVYYVIIGGKEVQAADPADLVGLQAPPVAAFSRDLEAEVSAETLQAHFRLAEPPVLVAAQPHIPRRKKRTMVWDAAGVGLCVRWDAGGIVAWLQTSRTDGPPWTGEEFARFNRIPLLG